MKDIPNPGDKFYFKHPQSIVGLVSCDTQDIDLFTSFYYEIAKRLQAGQQRDGVVSAVAGLMCSRMMVNRMPFNIRLKAAVQPILDLDDKMLEFYGLHLEKRTSYALALAFADMLLEYWELTKAQ